MADNNFISAAAATTADVLSAFSIPGGSTIQRLVDAHLEKRRAIAREVLLAELSSGFHGFISLGKEDLDPLISILMRFWRAAEEGVAKDNLRLLAQIIAGLKKSRALQFDSFARWARILENLERDDLLLIGTAYQLDRETKEPPGSEERRFYMPLRDHMAEKGFTNEEIDVLCMRISQYGLLRGSSGYGMLVYDATEGLRDLGKLADLSHLAARSRSS